MPFSESPAQTRERLQRQRMRFGDEGLIADPELAIRVAITGARNGISTPLSAPEEVAQQLFRWTR